MCCQMLLLLQVTEGQQRLLKLAEEAASKCQPHPAVSFA